MDSLSTTWSACTTFVLQVWSSHGFIKTYTIILEKVEEGRSVTKNLAFKCNDTLRLSLLPLLQKQVGRNHEKALNKSVLRLTERVRILFSLLWSKAQSRTDFCCQPHQARTLHCSSLSPSSEG